MSRPRRRLVTPSGQEIPWAEERAFASARQRAAARWFGGSSRGGYDGAGNSRPLKNWPAHERSADAADLPDLAALRGRSNDLFRNSPFGRGSVNARCEHAVGTGLQCYPVPNRRVLGLTEEQAREWALEARWSWELASARMDLSGRSQFWELQDLAFRSVLLDGDVLVLRRFVERSGDPFGVRIQLVPASLVCTPREFRTDEDVRAGVRTQSATGFPTRYYIAEEEPPLDRRGRTTAPDAYTTVPHRNRQGRLVAYLLFQPTRPNQTRGVPMLAPVIELLKQMTRLTEAEIDAAVLTSYLTIFVKSPGAEALGGIGDTGYGPPEPVELDQSQQASVETPKKDLQLGQGVILDLDPGDEVDTVDPNRPNPELEAFLHAMAQQIGMATGVPREVLVKEFTTSYSAARAAMLEAWRVGKRSRKFLGEDFCQPAYEWHLEEAVTTGRLQAPGFLEDPVARAAWSRALWIGDPMGQINPVVETQAAIDHLDLGLTTFEQTMLEIKGPQDYSLVQEQLAREVGARRDAGLDLGMVPNRSVSASVQATMPGDPE